MNMEEREKLVAETTESIFAGFSKSVSRVAALFDTPKEAVEKFISPEICDILNIPEYVEVKGMAETPVENSARYTGEVRNISFLLSPSEGLSWKDAIRAVYSFASINNALRFRPGDYILISADVPAVTIDNYKFDAVKIEGARLVVTEVVTDAVFFNFEDILFRAPINKKSTNEGGLSKSLLGKYLNDHFLKYVFGDVEKRLLPNKDGLKVTLPTRTEIFGGHESYPDDMNWQSSDSRHFYYKKCTNRIKVEHSNSDNTWFYWTSSPNADDSTTYCNVNSHGYASHYNASGTDGGVSPAICVAKATLR
jgi:hypothetical protein